eukprot:COSAG06_NODE_1515_length_9225_cov_75.448280_7_plen_176_part_00
MAEVADKAQSSALVTQSSEMKVEAAADKEALRKEMADERAEVEAKLGEEIERLQERLLEAQQMHESSEVKATQLEELLAEENLTPGQHHRMLTTHTFYLPPRAEAVCLSPRRLSSALLQQREMNSDSGPHLVAFCCRPLNHTHSTHLLSRRVTQHVYMILCVTSRSFPDAVDEKV